VSNNASNTTLNITRVMTTPLYALDNTKSLSEALEQIKNKFSPRSRFRSPWGDNGDFAAILESGLETVAFRA